MSGESDSAAARDALVAGETLVDCIPVTEGSLDRADRFERRAGGAPANVAVRLAQLGWPPLFWTRLARDHFGAFLARTLSDHGVPSRFVERDDEARTTLAFVGTNADGDQQFTFYRDGTADTRLQPGTVPDETLASVECVVAGGVSLSAEPARTAVLDLLERGAQAHDCTVVFDPNARPELWADGEFERVLERAFASVDVVIATADDLHAGGIEGEDGDLATNVFERGPHTLVLTRGADGATGHASADAPWPDAPWTGVDHDGYAVDPVDPTGAGDAFTAGLVAALARGERDPAELLAVANAVGAMATLGTGGMSELPNDGDVAAFRATWGE
jgi:fructokinase